MLMVALAGLAIVGLASPAQAVFQLQLEAFDAVTGMRTANVVVTDDMAGDLANPMPGQIVFSGVVGQFTINVTTGVSQPILPVSGNAFAEMDLNNITINTNGPGILRITLADTDFTNPPGGPQSLIIEQSIGGVLSGPPGSIVLSNSWANASNLVPTPTGSPGGITIPVDGMGDFAVPAGSSAAGLLSFPVGAFAGSSQGNFTKGPGAYSLFSEVITSFTGAGSVSFNQITRVLPAPGAVVLLLSGAPLFGFAYLRRRFMGQK
jgi:hypothetical protein